MEQEGRSNALRPLVRLQKTESEVSGYEHALNEWAIVAITDQKGVIRHVNENFCRISGYSKNELLGKDHRILSSGYHSKEYISELWHTISSGKMWRGEFRNRAKDNTLYWVDTTIVPFVNEEGPYQYLLIQYDITQKKLAEERLQIANQKLESAIRESTFELTDALERQKQLGEMKSRFVTMASHEFRTPLSAILSSLALLEHYTLPEDVDKRRKHIARIKASVKDLTDILDDLLSLEKLEHGKFDIDRSLFNIKELLIDTVAEMQDMLARRNQKIRFRHSGPVNVYQDKKILRYILLNLLSNASKFSADHLLIELQSAVEDDQLRIAVKDRGIGIPLEAQSELFSKFYRAHNAVHIGGTGLGLHIVKRILELLHGSISFRNREGAGTEFLVTIPIHQTTPTAPLPG